MAQGRTTDALDIPAHGAALAALRARLAAATAPAGAQTARAVLRFGHPAIDGHLPGGGLAAGALHEVAGDGPEVEHGAAAMLFVAGILAARLRAEPGGSVLWAVQGRDLFAPALSGVGLHPDAVIYAQASSPAAILLAMEDGLSHAGLLGVVGELGGRLSLTASRRLQLAAERSGTPAFVLRRSRRFDDPALREPCAASTRWRIASQPTAPPIAGQTEGLARARWRLDLMRCRGGEAASWIMEACDAQGRLGLPARLGDGLPAPGRTRSADGLDAAAGHRAA